MNKQMLESFDRMEKKNAKISKIMPASEFKRGTQNMNENLIYEEYDEIERKFYPSEEVLDLIMDQVTAQGGSREEAEIIAYALAQSSYEYGNGREYTITLYNNDITDTDDFLLNIDYYLRHDRDALELFKKYYFDALELVENLNKKQSQFNQLKESLGATKFNKIQSLINECLKEGMEVEITIPKKRLLKEGFKDEEDLLAILSIGYSKNPELKPYRVKLYKANTQNKYLFDIPREEYTGIMESNATTKEQLLKDLLKETDIDGDKIIKATWGKKVELN